MTPLQQAARELTRMWASREFTNPNLVGQMRDLRKALADEQAQEPVAQWQKWHKFRTNGRWENTDEHDAKWWRDHSVGWEVRTLFTHPAPPAGERAELVELPVAFGEIQYQRPSGQWGRIEGYTRNQMREAVAAAVAKAEAKHAQQVAVPPGYALVPIEPTREMVQACNAKCMPQIALPFFVAAYKTMVAAAPQPPQGAKP